MNRLLLIAVIVRFNVELIYFLLATPLFQDTNTYPYILKGRHCTSFNSMLDSYTYNMGSSPGENIIFVQALTAFHPVWTYGTGNQTHVHLIPCLCGVRSVYT